MAMQSGKEASVNSERQWREQFAQLVSAEELRSLSEQSLPDTFTAIGVLWVEVAILLAVANLLPRLTLVDSSRNPVGPLDGTEIECLRCNHPRGFTWLSGQIALTERPDLQLGYRLLDDQLGRGISPDTPPPPSASGTRT